MPKENLEMGRKYETQRELYPLTPELRAVKFSSIHTPLQSITTAKKNPKTANLGGALRQSFAHYFESIGIKDAPTTAINKNVRAVLARAVDAGFNVDHVHAGDTFEIKDSVLVYTTAAGEKLRILLSDEFDPKKQKEYLLKRSQIKEKTRQEWENALEADMSRILFDAMKARGIKFTVANRRKMWKNLQEMGKDFIPAMKAHGDKRLGTILDKDPAFLEKRYTGTALQKLAMIEYLRVFGLKELIESIDESAGSPDTTNNDEQAAKIETSTEKKDLIYKVMHLGEAARGKEVKGDVYTRSLDTNTEFGKQNIVIQLIETKGLRTVYTLPSGKKVDRTFVKSSEVMADVQREFLNCERFRKMAKDAILNGAVVPDTFNRIALETELAERKMYQVVSKDGTKTLMISQYPDERGKYRAYAIEGKKNNFEDHVDSATALKAVLEK